MKPKFQPMEYVVLTLWGVSSFIWLTTAIFSIVSHDGFTIIFLRFFVVFLAAYILFLTWCVSTQRIEYRAHENQLIKEIKNLRSKIKEYEVGK